MNKLKIVAGVLALVLVIFVALAVVGTFILGLGDQVEQEAQSIGHTVGGAQDANNFRDNIREGYLPIPTDITYEGLFNGYYFDTGGGGGCFEKFCPKYSTAVTEHPLTGETETYMTVGLDSAMEADDFERKKLNLVVVIDKSGSMGSGFGEYYYDRFGNKHEVEGTTRRPKMEVAKDAVGSVAEQLGEGDRLGVVTFDTEARIERSLLPVGDEAELRSEVERIEPGGSTHMSDGMDKATAMLNDHTNADLTEYENRVVFVTDAMPNTGEVRSRELLDRIERNADRGIHTTFVGVGVDYNTELVESITSVRGANYFSVHSAEEFERRMDEGFEYAVTPLVYDLGVEVEGAEVEEVYGTDADTSTGEVIRTETLFPSPQTQEGTKGGVVLVELDERDARNGYVRLRATWEERDGTVGSTERTVSFDGAGEEFDNDGVRKAVLLARYGRLMKEWARHEWADARGEEVAELGRWERQSEELQVSPEYRERIETFRGHFEREMTRIGDEDLEREVELMEELTR